MKNKNIVTIAIIAVILLLAIVPLALQKGAEFGGSDDQAESIITEVNPGYHSWFSSIWEPPSGEIESLLFALQAAIGAGFIGYYMGYARGQKKSDNLH